MRGSSAILPAAALLAGSAPVAAGEAFLGVMSHNVDLPTTLGSPEGGIDVQFGLRSEPVAQLLGTGELRTHLFGSANSGGGVNFAAVGINLRFPLGEEAYVQPGIGIAVQDGSTTEFPPNDGRLHLGSRLLFEPELSFGVRISDRWSAEIGWVHLSHAKLFSSQNPGLDDVGARLVFRF